MTRDPTPRTSADARPPGPALGAGTGPRGGWIAFGLTAGAMVLVTALRRVLEGNEADVLVAARHAVDPTWIPGDWYLGLDIAYRAAFNQLAGMLAWEFGLLSAAVIGRLLGILCVAGALTRVFGGLRLHPALVVPVVLGALRYRSIVAEEWIVGSFETKTFAYAAALLALSFEMERRWVAAAALSGAALSFHVLVGAYAAATLAAAAFLARDRSAPPARCALALFSFAAAAVPGALAIAHLVAAGAGVDRVAAGEVYVLFRVPHHTYPPHWGVGWWIARAVAALGVLALGVVRGRSPATRFVCRYGLLSASFAGIGALVLASGRLDLLKAYWFRFPDVILPLTAFVAASALLSERAPDAGPRRRRAVGVAAALSGALLVAAVPAFVRDAVRLASSTRDDPVFLRDEPEDLRAALRWVRDETPRDAAVLLDPFLARSYLATERAQLVSFKCAPQSDRDVLEWARRLAILAGVDDLRAAGPDALRRLEASAYRLPAPLVARVAAEFGLTHYVAARDHVLPYPVELERGRYRVYRIAAPASRPGR